MKRRLSPTPGSFEPSLTKLSIPQSKTRAGPGAKDLLRSPASDHLFAQTSPVPRPHRRQQSADQAPEIIPPKHARSSSGLRFPKLVSRYNERFGRGEDQAVLSGHEDEGTGANTAKDAQGAMESGDITYGQAGVGVDDRRKSWESGFEDISLVDRRRLESGV
ncbi:MAG: hypothetical protein Q9159_001816 [Coniocarpon cinnabarinum]